MRIVRDDDGDALTFRTSHALFDGLSWLTLGRHIDRLYAGGPAPEPVAFERHAWSEAARFETGEVAELIATWAGRHHVLADELSPFPAGGDERSIWPVHKTYGIRVGGGLRARFAAAARAARVTEFALELEIVLRSVEAAFGWPDALVQVPIGNRPSRRYADTVGPFADLAHFHLTTDAPRAELMRCVAATLDGSCPPTPLLLEHAALGPMLRDAPIVTVRATTGGAPTGSTGADGASVWRPPPPRPQRSDVADGECVVTRARGHGDGVVRPFLGFVPSLVIDFQLDIGT